MLTYLVKFKLFLLVVKFVNSDCPPIHTIVNGQIVSSQVDANCLNKENALEDPIATVRCPPINSVENGFIIGACQNIPSFTCKLGCMNGFQLSNPNPLTCMNDGQWSLNPLPVCENYLTNDCDVNNLNRLFKNGFINCSQNEYSRLTCRFTCHPGFALTGTSLLICQSNGKFNTIPPTCVSIENTNSLIEYNHSPITSPNLIYSKPFNYFVTSNSIQCSQVTHLKSGSTNCDCPANNIQLGCTCRFFCNEEYYLVGAPMIQCTKNGSWSHHSPVCKRGSACPLPDNLNKNVVLIHCNTAITGKCYYRCKGIVYYIDSTGKIKSNNVNTNRHDNEIEDKAASTKQNAKSSYDFTMKTNRCQRGGWEHEFACDIEEELNSLNKLNLTGDQPNSEFVRKRRRRRRRRPFRRIVPIRFGRPRLPNRPRRRRRRPSRRPKDE